MTKWPGLAATFLAAAFAHTLASATVTPVPAGTSIQDAIDAAAPGDTLVLEPGTYPGAVVVDKSLRIVGRGMATIDPLGAPVGLEVTADDVTIAVKPNNVGDALRIGAPGSCPTDAIIRMSGITGLRMRKVSDRDDCGTITAIGLDITNITKSRLRFVGVHGQQVGVRVRQLVEGADVRFYRSGGRSTNIGGLFEDIAPGAARRGMGVRVTRGGFGTPILFGDPPATALRLVNADRSIFANATPTGDIELDAASDNNIVRNGLVSDGVLSDAGSGNCFIGNEGLPDSCF